MTRYLFYNPDPRGTEHHNVKTMLAAQPGDVVAVPFGWTPEIEAARNELLKQLGVSGISALPCLLHFVDEHTADDGEGGKVTVPARWVEERIADHPRADWEWTKVEAAVEAKKPRAQADDKAEPK